MWKEIIVICLLLSVVFISGCVQTEPSVNSTVEAQAMDQIEQEMEDAIENIDMEDIESLLLT